MKATKKIWSSQKYGGGAAEKSGKGAATSCLDVEPPLRVRVLSLLPVVRLLPSPRRQPANEHQITLLGVQLAAGVETELAAAQSDT